MHIISFRLKEKMVESNKLHFTSSQWQIVNVLITLVLQKIPYSMSYRFLQFNKYVDRYAPTKHQFFFSFFFSKISKDHALLMVCIDDTFVLGLMIPIAYSKLFSSKSCQCRNLYFYLVVRRIQGLGIIIYTKFQPQWQDQVDHVFFEGLILRA